MGNRLTAQKIANFLNEELIGDDLIITHVKNLDELDDSSFGFSKECEINTFSKSLILVPKGTYFYNAKFSYICVENPRLAFAKVVENFFQIRKMQGIDSSVQIGVDSQIHNSVHIGINSIIGNNVVIGRNTIINSGVVIYDNTVIGNNCYIKSGSIIGEDGFGFDFEPDGTPIRIPHIGNVEIGNNVEIGAKNTIARATLGTTKIEDYVKIDDQVHIAHNCIIKKNTIITACTEISGSVVIGQSCWIGPNSSIMQKVKIGNNVTIGIGSIINKDIKDNKKIMGLEGLELRSLLKVKKRIEYGK